MDTTKQNIEMCKKAVKLQEGWHPAFADNVIFSDPDGHDRLLLVYHTPEGVYLDAVSPDHHWPHRFKKSRKNLTWLPRLDQLQTMVREQHEQPHGLVVSFYIWMTIDCTLGDLSACSGSMEQLWLAFVMHKVYAKRWDSKNKEWVKND